VSDAVDVLYVVRPGERNDPLRMSLRSLANLPHHRVFIAGYCPSWVKNVTAVPAPRKTDRFASIEANLLAGLKHPEISEQVIYFNDDFFVMEPIESVPVMHGGPVAQYNGKGPLKQLMRKTVNRLSAAIESDAPLFTYDGIHVPFPLSAGNARVALNAVERGCLWRTWYGNLHDVGGVETADVKSRDGKIIPGPFMSSNARAFHTLKHYLEDVLPRSRDYV
jgi:hypothetical protein